MAQSELLSGHASMSEPLGQQHIQQTVAYDGSHPAAVFALTTHRALPMQTSIFSLFDDNAPAHKDGPPAPGWVEECPGRWVRYSHPWRLMAQQDRPDQPWRWGCHRWPGMEPRRDGAADSPAEGAQQAERALATLQSETL